MKKIYMDCNATTPVHPEALQAMVPYMTDRFGNASSIHDYGQQARKAVEDARETVARFIGAQPDEIIFTSGGTESDNNALKGVIYANTGKGNHIITSSIEHPAVLSTCRYLETKGAKVTYLPVDRYGIVNPDDVRKSITVDTVLISIMHANNETGTVEPLSEIGNIAEEKEIYFHTDAVQSIGKIPVNVGELKLNMLSLSGHKIYGPKGVGVLYIRKGTKVEPFIHGGHHEKNRRAGTENVPGIVGLAKAVEIISEKMKKENEWLLLLRNKLWNLISKNIDHVRLNGHPEKRLPNTLNVSFEFVEGESIVLNMNLQGIAVSSGSACTSGSLAPSDVLIAMGVDPAIAQGSIRFSLGKDNREEDIEITVKALVETIARLRAMSPLYKKNK